MHDKTIAELSAALAAGEFTSLELIDAYLERIQRLDGGLNSFLSVPAEQARSAAREADTVRERGEAGPLTGVPLAFKDIFCTEDVRTSCGSLMLDNFAPPYDAHVVARFKAAGAVLLGKTNMDEFAMGSSNEASYYGAVRNPWDRDAVPGGSSGGSAAAVAARLTPGATGTDTGGSIRQPAALCGICGLKPTYGRVSRYGMIAFASSLDQAGPFARTAEDLALMLEVMAGPDERDSTSADRPVPHYSASLGQSVEGLTIGLPREFFGEGMDEGTREAVDQAVAEYERLGANVREVSLPNSHLAVPAYYVIAPAEASSNLSRFDGARYGYRCAEPQDLDDMYKRSRGEGFGPEVKRRIMVGTYALSAGYYEAYYRKAQQVRRLIRDDFVNALADVDLLLGPTSPTPAFDIGSRTQDPVQMYLSDIYTIAINLAGLPAVSIPAGESGGRPVGLQLVGDYFDEGRLLNAADQFQRVTDYHQHAPRGIE